MNADSFGCASNLQMKNNSNRIQQARSNSIRLTEKKPKLAMGRNLNQGTGAIQAYKDLLNINR